MPSNGTLRMGVQHGMWSSFAQRTNSHSLLECLVLGVVLFRDRDVLPQFRVTLWEALQVQAVCEFLSSRAIGVIARVWFQRVRLWPDNGIVWRERKDIRARHPDGIEERVPVEILGQRRLDITSSALGHFERE